jgi:cytochrome c556
MLDLQSAYWVLLGVHNGKSSDFAGAAGAARSMSDIMERFRSLMQPGTARGEAPGSRARPEVWSEADAFEAAANDFQAMAVSFSDVAARGNKDEYDKEFEALTVACTSCHGLRPSSGGRFRYATNE